MTSEELNRAIEFLTKQAAHFWAGMEEMKVRQESDYHELRSGLKKLEQQTARFETWAAEVVAIESRRLDEHDREFKEQKLINRELLRKMDLIIDRLLPPKN